MYNIIETIGEYTYSHNWYAYSIQSEKHCVNRYDQ
jgi:hypothetical protein